LLMTLRDASIRNIALRASGISEQSLRMITDIIENVRRMEHLPDPDAPGRRRGRPPRRPAADIDEGEKETTDEA
jgi:hypothetical protein